MSKPGEMRQSWASGVARWVPFAARTASYGVVSCVAGPLTSGRGSLWCMRAWCRGSARGLGIEIESAGLEQIRDAGPVVLIANHLSALDILVLGSLLDVDYRWAAKRSLFRIPFLGWHLALSGHIPVDRAKKGNVRVLQRRCAEVLASGAYLLFFPEGTRSKNGELQAFRSGAFLTAVQQNVPVIPIVIDGTERILRKGSWNFAHEAPYRVSVRVLSPIDAPSEGEVGHRARVLRDRTHASMAQALSSLRETSRARASSAVASRSSGTLTPLSSAR